MHDKTFLQWLHARLCIIHGEDECVDYMTKLQSIIDATDESQLTPNTALVSDPAVKVSNMESAALQYTGTKCSICTADQYRTPAGDTCANGHGGVEPLDDTPF